MSCRVSNDLPTRLFIKTESVRWDLIYDSRCLVGLFFLFLVLIGRPDIYQHKLWGMVFGGGGGGGLPECSPPWLNFYVTPYTVSDGCFRDGIASMSQAPEHEYAS